MSTTKPAPTPKRVLLFFPVFHSVLPAAFQNFLRIVSTAVHRCPQYRFDPWVVPRTSIHGAMNMAVETAIEQGHEYLIAFDDDCLPELSEYAPGSPQRWQVIPRMLGLGEAGHKIIMGVGYMRGFPHTTTVGRKYPEGVALVLGPTEDSMNVFKGFRWVDKLETVQDEVDENGLLDVDFCGVPIVCIHRSVLEKIEKPLFETRDEGGGQCTHDIYFCNKAKAAGFDVKVDTHIDCGHIVEAPIVNKFTKRDMFAALTSGLEAGNGRLNHLDDGSRDGEPDGRRSDEQRDGEPEREGQILRHGAAY